MITVTKEQVLFLHKCLFEKYGGSYGVRDESLLDSALTSPFQTFAGKELYEGDIKKIVRLSYGLISNHPFQDGNKRIGALVLLTLLKLNGYEIIATNKDLAEIIYYVASGSQGKYNDDLYLWVNEHISKY